MKFVADKIASSQGSHHRHLKSSTARFLTQALADSYFKHTAKNIPMGRILIVIALCKVWYDCTLTNVTLYADGRLRTVTRLSMLFH